MKSLISISLRAILILLKFVFIIFFSKFSSVENVGVYALMVSSLTLTVFFCGAELHASACRKIVTEKVLTQKQLIFTTHSVFVLLAMLLVIIFYAVLSYFNYLNHWGWLSLPFIILCFFELYSQEIGRYLLMMQMPVASNVLQLIKGGAWILPALYIISSEEKNTHINTVINFWLSASVLSVFFGLLLLRKKLTFSNSVDFKWLKSALSESRVYWYIAIMSQIQMYSDRFVLNYFSGTQEVGILSVFQNFTNVIQTFVQVGVIGIFLPKLISYFHDSERLLFIKTIRSMFIQTIMITISISFFLLIFINFVLEGIGKELYIQSLDIFYLQLLSSILLTLSLIPHIALYSVRADQKLFSISVKSLPVYLLILIFLTFKFGLYGVVFSTIFYNLFLLLLKSKVAFTFLKRKWNVA